MSTCYCMGPQNGDPYCPCEMNRYRDICECCGQPLINIYNPPLKVSKINDTTPTLRIEDEFGIIA